MDGTPSFEHKQEPRLTDGDALTIRNTAQLELVQRAHPDISDEALPGKIHEWINEHGLHFAEYLKENPDFYYDFVADHDSALAKASEYLKQQYH